jgi:hypothetical protein
MEAVRGAENYGFDPNYAAKAVWHNTIYPFTRNVVGPMDYTPVTFSNQKYSHLTTNAHELALALVYETGILHFADKVDSYTNLSQDVKSFIRNLPTTWDETKYIAGEPGKYVVIARRKGDKWYIGGINGQEQYQKVILNPALFKLTNVITDGNGKMNIESKKIDGSAESVEIIMSRFGGFVGL